MNLRMVCTLLFGGITLLNAATVSWQSSTQSAPWVDKGTLQTVPWDNDNSVSYVTVDEKTTYQEYDGQGGCFNEMGWKFLQKVPQASRDSVIRLLFDSVGGCNFSLCRMPLGMSDYSINYYSLNDTVNDYAMNNLSIERDRQLLIPYVKAAMKVRPDLKVWGSPWTPPYWMKDGSGMMKQDAQNLTAYALYFAKAVKAYQQEGLRYYAIHPQNEPMWAGSGKTWSCKWTGEQLRDFIKNYLGPRFRSDDVNAEMWLGTINCDNSGCALSTYVPITPIVFNDTLANSYCTGLGVQYTPTAASWTQTNYPDKRIMQTETNCGTLPTGVNPGAYWSYAEGTYNDMREYYKRGANTYLQWNMVLDTSGKNLPPYYWRQYAMVQIDTFAGKVIYTPQFHVVRHFGYVKPGAYRVAHSGTYQDGIAFRNPDGENVLVAANFFSSPATISINFNGQKIKPTLPAKSFNTFRIAGTPIPLRSPFNQFETESFTLQSGTYKKTCSEGGWCTSLINNNDWTCYRNLDFTTGAGSFSARVSGGGTGGTIEIRLDSMTGTVAGVCTVSTTAAWNTVSCPVAGITGKHTIYLKYKGAGTGRLFDFNWWKFSLGTSVTASMLKQGVSRLSANITPGKSPRLTVEFPGSFAAAKVEISLYSASGRLIEHLYTGRGASSRLSLPISRARVPAGSYVVRVAVDNAVACIRTSVVQ